VTLDYDQHSAEKGFDALGIQAIGQRRDFARAHAVPVMQPEDLAVSLLILSREGAIHDLADLSQEDGALQPVGAVPARVRRFQSALVRDGVGFVGAPF
jgi:hypothetical protein